MDAGKSLGAGLFCQGEHFIPGSEPVQSERGVHADALIAMGEKAEKFLLGNRDAKRLGEDGLRRLIGVRSHVESPDGTFAVERVAADPIGQVGLAVGAPSHADTHDSGADCAEVGLTERILVGLQCKGVHFSFRELIEEEMSAEFSVEGMAGLV